jgi:hypothetical protein
LLCSDKSYHLTPNCLVFNLCLVHVDNVVGLFFSFMILFTLRTRLSVDHVFLEDKKFSCSSYRHSHAAVAGEENKASHPPFHDQATRDKLTRKLERRDKSSNKKSASATDAWHLELYCLFTCTYFQRQNLLMYVPGCGGLMLNTSCAPTDMSNY